MIDHIRFVVLAWRGYRNAIKTGRPFYGAIVSHGVPQTCFYVATGREAWRVSQTAIEQWKEKTSWPGR